MKLATPNQETIYASVALTIGAFILGGIFWVWLGFDPMIAVVSMVLVYNPDRRAAWGAGVGRLLLTLFGSALAVGIIYLVGLHRWLLPPVLGVAVFFSGYFLKFAGAWRSLPTCVALVIGASLMDSASDVHIALQRALEVTAGCVLGMMLSWPLELLSRRR